MIWYFVAFFAAMAVDSVPIFAPPAWTVLVFLLVKFELNPWLVLTLGVIGSSIGRLILMAYIPKIGKRELSKKEDANLTFLGQRLSKSGIISFLFVLIYTLTPLSTTALFTAAGLAKVKRLMLIIPFAIGKFVSDGVMIFSGDYAVRNFNNLVEGMTSPKGIALSLVGFLIILAFLFIDWRTVLERKKLKFQFTILK